MRFLKDIKEKEYLEFANNNKAHFMQTWAWGLVNKETRDLIPCFVGIKDEKGKLLAASLLLKKKTPFGMSYFYAPRGFVMDMKNEVLLKEFTNGLKNYLKNEKGIYLKVDPGIKYHDIDENGLKIPEGENNYALFNSLINLGYIHKGFNKLYERNQPRYTFRINLNVNNFNEIEDKMNRTFLKTVRRSYDYDLKIKQTEDINTFYSLTKKNAMKDGFTSYSLKYYENLYNNFKKYNQIKIFEAILEPKKVINKFNSEIKILEERLANGSVKNKIDTENIINRYKNDIEILKEEKEDKVIVCSLICTYSALGAWTLYIGNDTLGTKTSAVNRLYYESIKDAYENKYDFMDLFGTVGDPYTKYKNLAGIYEFKRKIGGEYIEFIGEFDLINKRFWYIVLPVILKIYRKVRGIK